MVEHEEADARRCPAGYIHGVRGEPAQLETPPCHSKHPCVRCELRRKLLAFGVELHVDGLVERHPESMGFALEKSLDAREVVGGKVRDVPFRSRAAIAVERKDAHPQSVLPALGLYPIEPRAPRHDASEHTSSSTAMRSVFHMLSDRSGF